MVVGSAAFYAEGGSNSSLAPQNKCRYKTGKCVNARSSKRNGQPHQLCLYHRDKANKIQRKFDRQKRQVARMTKSSSSSSSQGSRSRASSTASNPAAFGMSAMSPAAAFAALSAKEVDMYPDSDSSRFSTDSDSSSTLEQVWHDLPHRGVHYVSHGHSHSHSMGVAPLVARNHLIVSDPLSHEEIDFLFAAMLE